MAKVKVNHPNLARGAEVEIPGLGVFKNGSTREVTEEQVENWRWFNQRPVEVGERPEGGVSAVEYQRGPTLKQAFEGVDYLEVVDDEPEEKSSGSSKPAEAATAEAEKKG